MNKILMMAVLSVGAVLWGDAQPVEMPEHECTSWIVFSDLTKNNTNILHKNRDALSRDLTLLMSPADSPRKWIGLGNAAKGMTDGKLCMGMNAKGLAAVMNSGEKCTDNSKNKQGMGTPAILQTILTNCDTASQALEMLKQIIQKEDYFHGDKGSIFFFLDKEEAYIVEMTAHFSSPQKYDHGYAYRANIWHNPDMASYSLTEVKSFLGSATREYMVFSFLNATIQAHGKVTPQDSLELSRKMELPGSPEGRTVCSKYTNSASSLVIDKEYPEVLSTAYVLIGPPRCTLCIPVPICVKSPHAKMLSQEWSQAAWKRFDKTGYQAQIPEKWLAFEKASYDQYGQALDQARAFLKAQNRAAAEKLLQDTAAAIWDNAAALLGI